MTLKVQLVMLSPPLLKPSVRHSSRRNRHFGKNAPTAPPPPPQAQFEELPSAARVGRIPSSITAIDRGMTLPNKFDLQVDETS